MLGFLMPDAVQRAFVDLARVLTLPVQGLAFAALCAALVVAGSFVLRRSLLELDAGLAMRIRRDGADPGALARSVGWIALVQWWAALILCAVFAVATFVFEAGRQGVLPSQAGPVALSRSVHLCLRAGSGRADDTLARCFRAP